MQPSYDLEAIVKFALRREVMTSRTYEKLAERATDGPTVNVLLQLVEFELGHVRQFTEVLRPQIERAGLDPRAIVRAAEAEPLELPDFLDPVALEEASLVETLARALDLEHAMASYYAEAAVATRERAVHEVLERLAGEEKHHARLIEDLIGGMALDPAEDPKEFPAL